MQQIIKYYGVFNSFLKNLQKIKIPMSLLLFFKNCKKIKIQTSLYIFSSFVCKQLNTNKSFILFRNFCKTLKDSFVLYYFVVIYKKIKIPMSLLLFSENCKIGMPISRGLQRGLFLKTGRR